VLRTEGRRYHANLGAWPKFVVAEMRCCAIWGHVRDETQTLEMVYFISIYPGSRLPGHILADQDDCM
jgi:hypothetical protein